MLWVALNKMLERILSPDSNSELEKYIEAKKCDDFIFENRNFDDKSKICALNREECLSIFMPKLSWKGRI